MVSSARQSFEQTRPSLDNDHPTSTPLSLSRAVYARRAEYTRPQKIKIKIGSWNVAACPGTELDLRGWFIEGKGFEQKLSELQISNPSNDHGNVESVSAQEDRITNKDTTIPKGDPAVIAGGDEIGLYVLGLQEVVELSSAKEYIGRVYSDTGPTAKWRNVLQDALPPGYTLVAEQLLSGLLLFVFASPAIAPTITSVSSVSVGTGIMGYLGNKGAVITRIILGETTRMVFINSHLASGADLAHLDRRCWDVSQILQRTSFDPISWAGVLDDRKEGIGEEDFAFWFGDLNFRLDGLPGNDIRRLLMLHTKGEYDVGQKSRNKMEEELRENDDGPIVIRSVESDSDEDNSEPRISTSTTDNNDDDSSVTLPDPDDFVQDPSQDPASLQATLDSLLPHDQLRHVQKQKKAFQDGWREGPITFLPTYKYDVGSMGMFDSSEKKRAPSWCDRVLFRTRRDKLEYDRKRQAEETIRKKDEEMTARGVDHAQDDEDILFDYDPDEDGVSPQTEGDVYDEEDEQLPEEVITKEGYLDRINLDLYTSHQKVLSSDHKPLSAVFTLEYDSVVPGLKSKIQQEVAREIDRVENESRPGITVVVDRSQEVEDVVTPHGAIARQASTGRAEGVDFGNVSYQQRKVCNLTIANTSQVTSTFAFVSRPSVSGDADQVTPSWLTVSFLGSNFDDEASPPKELKREIPLDPGDAVHITLELYVDSLDFCRELNQCTSQLDDVLILRVTDGRDHFVPIRGTWLQSCFGRSVDELIRIPEGGVRALLPKVRDKTGAPINRGQEVCWSAPRELFKLTEAVESLIERVTADANMVESAQLPRNSAGWPFDRKSWLLKDGDAREDRKYYVLEFLDADKNLNDSFSPEIPAIERFEILADVLVSFLGGLTDGIVPASLWSRIEQDIAARGTKQLTDDEEIKAWILDVLSGSPNHNISFVFLTSMLCRVANEICPVQKTSWKENKLAGARSSLDTVRRSLSWKSRPPAPIANDPAVIRRQAVAKAYADVFSGIVFRGATTAKDKERSRDLLEVFLKGS